MRTTWKGIAAATALWAAFGCSGLLDPESWVVTPVPPPTTDWIGAWHGTGTDLTIAPDGLMQLERVGERSQRTFTAPVVTWPTPESNKLIVALGPVKTPYEVQQLPHLSDGEWRMVFDGVLVTRELDTELMTPPPSPGGGLP